MPSSSSSVNPSARWSGCSGATCVKGRSLPWAEDRSRLRFLPVSRHQLISIRRARLDDLDFLFELVNDEEVEPYLGGRASLDRESLLAEIDRSEAERAIVHAERSGFVREGVKRKAYFRHGEWVDGVMYGLLREDLPRSSVSELLRQHVERFNAGVRTGDWSEMLRGFDEVAEMEFRGVPVGPFHGKDAIADAYRAQPPDDELRVLEERERDGRIEA